MGCSGEKNVPQMATNVPRSHSSSAGAAPSAAREHPRRGGSTWTADVGYDLRPMWPPVRIRPTLILVVAGSLLAHAALGAAGGHTSIDMLPVLEALALILVLARLGGALFERFGQPAVLGELLAGIVIGNLGLVGFHAFDALRSLLAVEAFAQIGVLFLLFQVGLASDVAKMAAVGASATLVAVLGVIAPMLLGLGVSEWFLRGHQVLAHWFVGATLAATSVGITARVLTDLGRSASVEGRIILGAAVIDDVLGLLVLAVVTGLIQAAGAPGAGAGRTFDALGVAGIAGEAPGAGGGHRPDPGGGGPRRGRRADVRRARRRGHRGQGARLPRARRRRGPLALAGHVQARGPPARRGHAPLVRARVLLLRLVRGRQGRARADRGLVRRRAGAGGRPLRRSAGARSAAAGPRAPPLAARGLPRPRVLPAHGGGGGRLGVRATGRAGLRRGAHGGGRAREAGVRARRARARRGSLRGGPGHDPARRGGAHLRQHRAHAPPGRRARRRRHGLLGGRGHGGGHHARHAAAPRVETAGNATRAVPGGLDSRRLRGAQIRRRIVSLTSRRSSPRRTVSARVVPIRRNSSRIAACPQSAAARPSPAPTTSPAAMPASAAGESSCVHNTWSVWAESGSTCVTSPLMSASNGSLDAAFGTSARRWRG